MKYVFYIIYSKTANKYYIGHSSNIVERIQKHNTNHKGYTGKANDWQLAYYENFETKSEAYARERQIKKWKNRNRLKELINKGIEHPDLQSGRPLVRIQ